jgi:hypothetical protein
MKAAPGPPNAFFIFHLSIFHLFIFIVFLFLSFGFRKDQRAKIEDQRLKVKDQSGASGNTFSHP